MSEIGREGKTAQGRSGTSEQVEHITVSLEPDLQRALIEDSKRRGKELREQLPIAIVSGLRLYAAAYVGDFKRPNAP